MGNSNSNSNGISRNGANRNSGRPAPVNNNSSSAQSTTGDGSAVQVENTSSGSVFSQTAGSNGPLARANNANSRSSDGQSRVSSSNRPANFGTGLPIAALVNSRGHTAPPQTNNRINATSNYSADSQNRAGHLDWSGVAFPVTMVRALELGAQPADVSRMNQVTYADAVYGHQLTISLNDILNLFEESYSEQENSSSTGSVYSTIGNASSSVKGDQEGTSDMDAQAKISSSAMFIRSGREALGENDYAVQVMDALNALVANCAPDKLPYIRDQLEIARANAIEAMRAGYPSNPSEDQLAHSVRIEYEAMTLEYLLDQVLLRISKLGSSN